MRHRITTIGLLVAALLAIFTPAAACGDNDDSANGGALTLQQYLERLEELNVEYHERTDALEADYDEDIASIDTDAEGITISNKFLRTGGNAITTFINGIERLNPPAEAGDVHDTAVSTGRAMAAGIADLTEELDETTTQEEYEALFEDSSLSVLGDAFEQSCFDTQDLADDNGIDATFICDE